LRAEFCLGVVLAGCRSSCLVPIDFDRLVELTIGVARDFDY
jgi:hypothetical protein